MQVRFNLFDICFTCCIQWTSNDVSIVHFNKGYTIKLWKKQHIKCSNLPKVLRLLSNPESNNLRKVLLSNDLVWETMEITGTASLFYMTIIPNLTCYSSIFFTLSIYNKIYLFHLLYAKTWPQKVVTPESSDLRKLRPYENSGRKRVVTCGT